MNHRSRTWRHAITTSAALVGALSLGCSSQGSQFEQPAGSSGGADEGGDNRQQGFPQHRSSLAENKQCISSTAQWRRPIATLGLRGIRQ